MTGGERVDTAPFIEWFDRHAQAEGQERVFQRIGWSTPDDDAHSLDTAARRLYRWRDEQPTARVLDIADALEAAGLDFDAIYEGPEYEHVRAVAAGEVELEDDGFCASCHEVVTPIAGKCPWCDSDVVGDAPPKRYCATCDGMRVAHDGACWRCGDTLTDAPWEPCACGCGQMKRQFDPKGRRVRYVRGHAPREPAKGELPIEPFARHLEDAIASLDVIGAVARMHGLKRDDVLAILERHTDSVPREWVIRGLWINMRSGSAGPGAPMRPGAPRLHDLYPDDLRRKTCPGCGGGKARHADLCKSCRRKEGRRHAA